MNLRRYIAGSAMLFLLAAASPAFAQPVPTPPVVGTTNGLTADSSRSPIGFKPPTPENIGDYIKAVGAVEVNAAFHSTKELKVSKDVKVGPFNPNIDLVKLRNGADVNLHAKYSKKDGSDVATLDGITLNAKGVDVGPQLGPLGLKFQRAEIHADGSMSVKLNSWIPELTIKKVEKQPNGDVKLIGSWWMPDCTITKDGDVKIGKVVKIFGKEIGGLKTVGKIDPRIFANWPPSLQDFMTIAAAMSGQSVPGQTNPLAGTLKQLGGGLAWDVKAEAEGLPIEIEGAGVDAKTKLHIHGNANLEDGRFTTIGDKNKINLKIDVTDQKFGNDQTGMTLKKGAMELDGTYRLDVPLDDAKNKMVVTFDGKAAYSAEGEALHVTLPTGAKINVAHVEVAREGDVHFNMNGANRVFKLDDARYLIAAKGPISIEKLGPISALELDGELRSEGLSKIRADGLLALNGDLKGSMVVRNGGALNRLAGNGGFYASTLKPGSRVDVDLHDVFAAMRLPVDGKKAGFEGANVRGKVGVHGEVGDLGYKNGTIDLAAPSGTVDLTVDGSAKIRGTGVTGEGDVTGSVSLPNGATVNVAKGPITARTSIDPGSHVDLNAHVKRTGAGAAQNEQVVTTANLNARRAADLNSPVLRVIPKGTKLEILSRQGDWAQIKVADGEPAQFVNTRFVNTTRPASTAGAGTTTVNGRITGDLGATDATVSALGGTADLKANVHAGIDAPFAATIGPDGKPKIDTNVTKVTAPIRVQLKRGTRVNFKGQTVTLTDDACYLQVTGEVALDGNGKPVLKKLSNVDVELRLGNLGTQLFGLNLNVPNLATTKFKGDVTFGPNGIEVHGNAQVMLGGQTAPLINISF